MGSSPKNVSLISVKERMGRSCGNCFSSITVEPCLFFFALSQGLYVIIAQNLYIAKVCNVNFNLTKEVCDDILNKKEDQLDVQRKVSELQAYNGILQAIPSIVYALFAGPWSDQYGRKMVMIWSCFGFVFNNGVFIINTYWFYELKAEYLLFECLQDLTGGWVVFFLACYSYISDISTRENRTKRLAILDGLFPAGFFMGMGASGRIKEHVGFYGNFILGMSFALLSMFYAIFFLKDSRTMRPPEVQKEIDMLAKQSANTQSTEKGLLPSLFDIKNLKSGFAATFKKRPNNARSCLLLFGVCFLIEMFLITGKGPTIYLYYRRKFSWDAKTFGMFISFYGFLGMFAQFFAVPILSKRFKWSDTRIALLGIVGTIIQFIIVCFTPVTMTYLVYVAGVISLFSTCISTTYRSMITKLVGPLEIGKVFSVLAAFQATMPLLGNPTYGFIYKATVATFPGVFLLFSVGLYLLMLVILWLANWRMVEQTVSPEAGADPQQLERFLESKVMKDMNNTATATSAQEDFSQMRFNEVSVTVEKKY